MTTASPHQPPLPFQFTLRQLLSATTIVCVSAAAGYWFGPGGTFFTLLMTAFLGLTLHFATTRRFGYAETTVLIMIGVVIVLLLWPNVQGARVCYRWGACQNNMRNIALALQNYHDDYGSFPPAYITDADGKPMHSWRVLILPYIEQQNLYDLYRFDEPWDGPNNSQLHSIMLRYFSCPSDPIYGTTTSYLAVTGPQTIWPGATTTKMSDIKDGPANTILLVEAHNTGIHWMEPRDLDFTTLSTLSSTHHHGRHNFTNVVFADGHHQPLPDTTPAKSLRAALTVSGQKKSNFQP